jgi:hypothetical protein
LELGDEEKILSLNKNGQWLRDNEERQKKSGKKADFGCNKNNDEMEGKRKE